jgi:hypothetical protein
MSATFQRVRTFKAAAGAGFSDADAERFGKFLEGKLGLGSRPVSPEAIVEAARPTRSPLHRQFTWDDTEAATRYRISEARHLVTHIVVATPLANGGQASVRAFHSVATDSVDPDVTARGYVSERVVWTHPEWSAQVVARARAELRGWQRRYATYEELQHLMGAIDDALEEGK